MVSEVVRTGSEVNDVEANVRRLRSARADCEVRFRSKSWGGEEVRIGGGEVGGGEDEVERGGIKPKSS